MQEFDGMLDGIVDPRRSNATRHDFQEMLVIALITINSGGETCTDMALFGKGKEEFLRGFMRPGHGEPRRLPGSVQPDRSGQLGGLLPRFARDWSEGIGDGVAVIDGKALRSTVQAVIDRGGDYVLALKDSQGAFRGCPSLHGGSGRLR